MSYFRANENFLLASYIMHKQCNNNKPLKTTDGLNNNKKHI